MCWCNIHSFIQCNLYSVCSKSTEEKPNEAPPPRPKGFRPLYDIPWMFEAREFLRKKLIGKKVNVVVDYIQTARDNFPEKVCCTVTIGGVWVLLLSLILIELFTRRSVVRSFGIGCSWVCLIFTAAPLVVRFQDSYQIISAALKISMHETVLYSAAYFNTENKMKTKAKMCATGQGWYHTNGKKSVEVKLDHMRCEEREMERCGCCVTHMKWICQTEKKMTVIIIVFEVWCAGSWVDLFFFTSPVFQPDLFFVQLLC